MSRSDEEMTRFTASLRTTDYERLGELAGLLGVSRASLLRDLVEAARPVWAVLIDAARTTAEAPAAQREAMARLADEMGESLEHTQSLFDSLAAIVAPPGPPPSNTGVRNL